MKKKLVAVLAMVIAAGLLGAVAQQATKAVAEVPFSFIGAGKTFPPGTYQFSLGKLPNQIFIRNTKETESAMVTASTRLSAKPGDDPVIVFDKVDNDHYFSELYLPGRDGYAVQGAKGEHTHVLLKAKQ